MKLLFATIPKLAKTFSEGSPIKYLLILVSLWYFVLTKKVLGSKADFTLNVFFKGKTIRFFLRYVMDLAVLKEIFLDKEYEWSPVSKPEVIIDLGAHFGDTSLYYNARFPDAKIIAVEPSPENFERLVKHTSHIPNIFCLQAAVSSSDGFVRLNLVNSTLGHSVLERSNIVESVEVLSLSLESLVDKYDLNKIDLLKFDIEGAEFSLFEKLQEKPIVSTLIGELHLDLVKEKTLEWVEDKLRSYTVEFEPLDQVNRYVIMAVKK